MYKPALFSRLCLLVLLSFVWSGEALAEKLSDVSRAVNAGLGRVLVLNSGSTRINSTGSGFVVHRESNGDLLFVTNAHVASSRSTPYIVGFLSEEGLKGSKEAKYSLYKGTLEHVSRGQDLAVLRLTRAEKAPKIGVGPLAVSIADLSQGLEVASFGYPGIADGGAGFDDISFYQSSLTSGVISRITTTKKWGLDRSGPEVEVVHHDAAINSGNSGGPLVNTCGQVIGVNTAMRSMQKGRELYFASSASEIRKFLLANKVPFNAVKSDCEDGVARGNGFLGLGAVSATTWSIVLTVLGLGAVVAAMVWNHKRKASQSDSDNQPARRRDTAGKSGKAVLEIRPTVDGASQPGFMASAEKLRSGVTIGRASSCDVTLSDPKASRTHARLDLEGRRLVVHDLGSTNHTYVDDTQIPSDGKVQVNTQSRIRIGNTLIVLRKP